jgi:hypothetical protein
MKKDEAYVLLLEGVLLVLRRVLPVYYSQKYKNNEYNTGLDMGKGIWNKRTKLTGGNVWRFMKIKEEREDRMLWKGV